MEQFLIENEMNEIIAYIRAMYMFKRDELGPVSLAKVINFGTDTITEVGGALIALYWASLWKGMQLFTDTMLIVDLYSVI